MPVKDAISAGGVAWRCSPDGRHEIVVCGRVHDRVWGLPKGTPEGKESLEQTALREVSEETGLDVALGPQLASIDYWFVAEGVRVHKRVHYWLMEVTGGDVAHHDREFDDVRWVSFNEANELMTYRDEKDVVADAQRRLLEEPWTSVSASG
jgi:8-oxo-dGTP pyrophosphatase MutT (NUDIX family)